MSPAKKDEAPEPPKHEHELTVPVKGEEPRVIGGEESALFQCRTKGCDVQRLMDI